MSILAPPIHLMENHDAAYHVWRKAGVRDRVLVHIDAHHDMWWLDDMGHLSIANFVCPALKDGMVREVRWIVPDSSFSTAASRARIVKHLRRIVERYPGAGPIAQGPHEIRTTLLGRPLIVRTLGEGPRMTGPVLLDIDIDYLLISQVTYGRRDVPLVLPWQWPAQLVARLAAGCIRSDLITIAYSVDGGYTPITWKYLGDELAARLRSDYGEAGDSSQIGAFEQFQAGAVAQANGDVEAAAAAFLSVAKTLGAAPWFRLAWLRAEQGRIAEGRECLARAAAIDATYQSPFATPGIPLYCAGRDGAAKRAFELAQSLDPADPYARLGLAWVAARRRQWARAESHARSAMAIMPELIDAHRALAEALDRQGRSAEAIPFWEQSLKLALHGRRPFNGVIATNPDGDRLLDGDHAAVHARLARAYEQTGEIGRAITSYRIAIAAGYRVKALRSRVERLSAPARRALSGVAGTGSAP